jgi:hypothetical protein
MTLFILEIAGCQTTGEKPRATRAKPSQSDHLFLLRGDYSEELGLLIQKVFSSHQFLHAWIAVKSPDSSIWFVAEREITPIRFDRLYVQISPRREVSASITTYQFARSDWAILGSLVVNFKPEAERVADEISRQLKESNIKVK